MPSSTFRYPSSDGTQIAAYRWDPPGLALLTPLTDRYAAAGLTDVTVRTYPGARHEVLNETNKDEITADLISWINRVLAGSR